MENKKFMNELILCMYVCGPFHTITRYSDIKLNNYIKNNYILFCKKIIEE